MIDIENLEVTLSKKVIVDGVTIDVSRGEFVGIIGPNGSGKSTLLKTVYRVLKASEGTVMVDGTDIRDMTLKQSALKMSVVTQHNYYNFDFKAKDVVLMGRSPHKRNMEMDNAEDIRIVDEALERVGMTDFADRNFYTLSGGEQQRIVLARALAQQTPCMILDEPTNHLDVKYQLQLMDVVGCLGITVLAALHDLNIAAAYCDRLYLMKDGRIAYHGTPEEVLTEKNILEVYGVEATVSISPHTGLLNIEYHPGIIRRKSAGIPSTDAENTHAPGYHEA